MVRTAIINVCLFLFLYGCFIHVHEVTHKTVYKYFGCDSEINLFHLPPQTVPEKGCVHTETLTLAQSIVDAVGYHLGFIYLALNVLILKEVRWE